MTLQELPPYATSVKRAATSSSTCTAATVEALAALFHDGKGSDTAKKDDKHTVQCSKPYRPVAQPLKSRSTKSNGRPGVAVFEVAAEETLSLEPEAKIRLATEVVNASLKELTTALKVNASRICSRSENDISRTSSGTPCQSNLGKDTVFPLQPRCANRSFKVPDGISRSRRSSSVATMSTRTSGTLAVAECARTAFSALRKFDSQRPTATNMPHLQIERGMLALIGKLIALGMEDLAVKELWILWRRLSRDVPMDRVKGKSKQSVRRSGKDCASSYKQRLVDLLCFNVLPSSVDTIILIVTIQLHVLKLLALRMDPYYIEAALDHLQLSASYSPANLLEVVAADQSVGSNEKVSGQFNLLASSIFALCPSPSSMEDDTALDVARWASPGCIFRYQLLALRIRLRGWNSCGHEGDLQKDLVDPFGKFLRAYIRRSTSAATPNIELLKEAISTLSTLYGASAGTTPLQQSSYNSKRIELIEYLAVAAMTNHQYSDGLFWFEELLSISQPGELSKARICSTVCNIANLQIRTSAGTVSEETILLAVRRAVQALKGDLQGDSKELDEILISSASLRKVVLSTLLKAMKRANPQSAYAPNVFHAQYLELIIQCVLFLTRYIGKRPQSAVATKQVTRYEERLLLASHVWRPTLESVVSLAKLPLAKDPALWKEIAIGLNECVKLAHNVEDFGRPSDNETAGTEFKCLPFVLLSNTYWFHFLGEDVAENCAIDTLSSLRVSIDLISQRTLEEKRAGYLPVKLEKLSNAYESSGQFEKAMDVLSTALSTLASMGTLKEIASAASRQPLNQAFSEVQGAHILERILASHVRISQKAGNRAEDALRYYDDALLQSNERGVLLEKQLDFLQKASYKEEPPETTVMAFERIGKHLLEVYAPSQYPVRHLRASNSLLCAHFARPKLVSPELVKHVEQGPAYVSIELRGADEQLARFVPYLMARRDVYKTFLAPVPKPTSLKSALDTFSKLVTQHCEWPLILEQIDDVTEWFVQLDSMVDYYHMQGQEEHRVSVLQIITALHGIRPTTQYSSFTSKLSALGLQYIRLGYSGKAGVALRRASQHIEEHDINRSVVLQWHLAYAEYLLEVGQWSDCFEHTDHGIALFQEVSDQSNQGLSMTNLCAQLNMLLSRVLFVQNKFSEALFFGRKSAQLSSKAWGSLERRLKCQIIDNAGADHDENVSDVLTEGIRAMSLSSSKILKDPPKVSKDESLGNVGFWPLVPSLFQKLANLSFLFTNKGSYLEASYYAERAAEIADGVQSPSWQARARILIGDCQVRAGHIADGLAHLKGAEILLSQCGDIRIEVDLHSALARAYGLNGQRNLETSALELAQKLVAASFSSTVLAGDPLPSETSTGLESQLSALKISGKSVKKEQKTRRQMQSSRSNPTPVAASLDSKESKDLWADYIPILRVKLDLARQQVYSLLQEKKLVAVGQILSESGQSVFAPSDITHQELLKAQLSLQSGLDGLSTDPVYSVVPESTVSCPSILYGGRRRSRDVVNANVKEATLKSGARKTKFKTASKDLVVRHITPSPTFNDLLLAALGELHALNVGAQGSIPTATIHIISECLSKTLILLSSTCPSTPKVTITSTFISYAMELGRSIATMKEVSSIEVGRSLKIPSRLGSLENIPISIGRTKIRKADMNFSDYQANYIDIIPASWTVFSISLSENREELRLSKIRSGQVPFVVNIPIKRQGSHCNEDEDFGFKHAKEELLDIIDLANHSTHDGANGGRKMTKSQWWQARETLDARLKDLLVNIENVWLGGFKAVLTRIVPRQDLLSRFQQSFYNILKKHLPSRQKNGRNTTANQPLLDTRVLELFLGLGDPTQNQDLDEPLMDILYFVVDILQFHGERNAYDEIDFDSIAVETLDALSHYHETARSMTQEQASDHTILVLDKALHCFPWESIPCLRDHAISRMPSLSCLREKILQQGLQSGKFCSSAPGCMIDAEDGAYVLNPAGDLVSTQKTFQGPLAKLSTWSATTNRVPSEADIISCLSTRSLYLYFGHGSGGQYVRSRAIKELDRCAVALLLGCSSAAMTEAGEFESYGVPMTYLCAGAPAVVGTLWDVTDKDIDRFSLRALERWGLFEAASEAQGSPVERAARGRRRVGEKLRGLEESGDSSGRGKTGLDQAVAEGREACVLKYLNGAAPVVYGIPVFLS